MRTGALGLRRRLPWNLGSRPTFDGLEIAPGMPSAWRGFDAVRSDRGVRYAIHVVRAGMEEVRVVVRVG